MMVAIPQTHTDPTLDAMRAVCKQMGNTKERRNYLGASLIGNECSRQIWYDYTGAEKADFEAETLWNFQDGHRTEDLIAERLRLIPGIQLWTHDEAGKQFGFSDLDGKFKGHFDGVIVGLLQAPKTNHIWECKASGQKKFDEFKKCVEKFGEKNALKNWNSGYYVQAQLYMHYTKLTRHYLTVAYAGGRDIASCRTEYDREFALNYIERAKMIIGAKTPPARISEKSDFYMCRHFCDFAKVCHVNS